MKDAFPASSISSKLGMLSVIPMPIPGFVPYVIRGSISAASKCSSLSNTASSPLFNFFQYSTALSQSSPLGAYSLPLRYSNVTSSGATNPPLAPISIERLQRVRRPSIDMFFTTEPEYSTKYPVAPEVVSFAIRNKATSFAVTPLANTPSIFILIDLGFCCNIHCEASTISTSLVPMPNATAPTAP